MNTMMNEAQLHAESLRLGRIFRALYAENRSNQATLDALEDYIQARRALPRREDKFHSRYGATEAYDVTQGLQD